jgi:hypothetical protein
LRTELVDRIDKEEWIVLPYYDVQNLPGLRLSPMGIMPQHNRRPRIISDLSFFGLNSEVVPIAPLDSMQFGRALDRILRTIVTADPSNGPVKLMKLDLADGFYRVGLQWQDIAKLGVRLPQIDDQPPLVALPLVLPMGFSLSPPIFTAATETIADLANANILKWRNPPLQRLEADAYCMPIALPPTPATVPKMRYLTPPARRDPSFYHKRQPRPQRRCRQSSRIRRPTAAHPSHTAHGRG